MEQLYTSSKTSNKQIPALHKFAVESGFITPNSGVADIGCGRYDLGMNYLSNAGAIVIGYDPFNRDEEFNNNGLLHINSGMVDVALVANVLNVIKEEAVQEKVIALAAQCHTALFSIHPGDNSGIGKQTVKGWQNNKPAQDYVELVAKHFKYVSRKGKFIIAYH